MSGTITIGKRRIGNGQPCFIVAEIGINHNGDFDLATRTIEAAARAGADAVKFQNYHTEDFLADRSLTYTYKSQGREVTESQWDMFARCEPKADWLPRLKRFCDDREIVFFSTPMSEAGVRDLVKAGVLLLKNGSDCLTHLPLLECMGRTGIPTIVSTGMADQQDIDDAVAAVRKGSSPLILLHCTSAYPTPLQDVNLRRMTSLRERYALPVGFSDHTEGWHAAIQAVTLGACMIEKHFTLDHNLPGPDHWFSSTPAEFAELVLQVRAGEQRLGRADILPAGAEKAGRQEYRLSAAPVVDLNAGTILAANLIRFQRPGTGILARDLEKYVGRRLLHPVSKGTPLQPADFDPS
jgi:N-acetylneuraminate synthase/N,N'-diacetyllegionaminate synthase